MFVLQWLENFTHYFVKWAGSAGGFIGAIVSLMLWILVGKIFAYSVDWENGLLLYIGVITFLMIFLIQRGQNKELTAIHLKLNELIAATQHADNSVINIQEQTEKEMLEIQEIHRKIGADGGA